MKLDRFSIYLCKDGLSEDLDALNTLASGIHRNKTLLSVDIEYGIYFDFQVIYDDGRDCIADTSALQKICFNNQKQLIEDDRITWWYDPWADIDRLIQKQAKGKKSISQSSWSM